MTKTRLQSLCLAIACLAACACSKPQSERCRNVCQQESVCAAGAAEASNDEFKYDQDECVAACVALERDSDGKQLVEKHVECAKKAGHDCQALMACR